jgi:hypothetical protein
MKGIEVSNATFGLIWSLAVEADRTEEDILRRVLGGQQRGVAASTGTIVGSAWVAGVGGTGAGGAPAAGFTDPRYGVTFPEGMSIFRTYQGKSYTAQVLNGKWIMAEFPGQQFDSLNALNKRVGANSENAWYSWYFRANGGARRRIGDLRPAHLVAERKKNKGGQDLI